MMPFRLRMTTPVRTATCMRCIECVRALLTCTRIYITVFDKLGYTYFICLCFSDYIGCLKLVLSHKDADMNVQAENG